jgi:membrane associated rhomboid family serine protease
MIEDRDYLQASYGGPWYRRLSMALWLVIINVVFYGAQLIVPLITRALGSTIWLENSLALQPWGLVTGKVWQLFTFQLLHAGPLHLILNCAMLYIFGRQVESALGRASFLKLYFVSGAVGGLLQVGLSFIFREHFGYAQNMSGPPVVGASAGVFGLIAAFATLFRDTPVTMFLAFIIPVSMKAKFLLLAELILAVLGLLDARSGVAHGAHLGGMLMGIFYVTQVIHWNWHLPRVRFASSNPPSRELVKVTASKLQGWRRQQKKEEPLSTEEFLSREVDPILDKISQHGIHSLTERERKILEAARRKMDKH